MEGALCHKASWLPGKLLPFTLRNRMCCFPEGNQFPLQQCKYSAVSSTQWVCAGSAMSGTHGWAAHRVGRLLVAARGRPRCGAAQDMRGSALQSAEFRPLGFKVFFFLVKREGVKRSGSSNTSVDQSSVTDLSFLFPLTHFCFVGNLLLLIARTCSVGSCCASVMYCNFSLPCS